MYREHKNRPKIQHQKWSQVENWFTVLALTELYTPQRNHAWRKGKASCVHAQYRFRLALPNTKVFENKIDVKICFSFFPLLGTQINKNLLCVTVFNYILLTHPNFSHGATVITVGGNNNIDILNYALESLVQILGI